MAHLLHWITFILIQIEFGLVTIIRDLGANNEIYTVKTEITEINEN